MPVVIVAVVDDDEAILDAMTFLIEGQGWESKTYVSGEAFLTNHREDWKIDCLVLDPHLAGISGEEVARALIGTNVPIVGLTARPESSVARAIEVLGIETMLKKPATYEDLVTTIERIVNSDSSL